MVQEYREKFEIFGNVREREREMERGRESFTV
jgi:hypothetical protein